MIGPSRLLVSMRKETMKNPLKMYQLFVAAALAGALAACGGEEPVSTVDVTVEAPPAVEAPAADDEELIVQAVQEHLADQDALEEGTEVVVDQIEGEHALATIRTNRGEFIAFLQRHEEGWITLVSGSGFSPEQLQELGIPADLLPPAWIVTDETVLTLSEEMLAPGDEVQVVGSGFTPGTQIALRLGIPDTELSEEDLAEVTVGDEGVFTATVTIPSEWPGSGAPLIEQEVNIVAVDLADNESIATEDFLNVAARTAGEYRPIDAEMCEDLRGIVSEALDAEATIEEVAFNDYINHIPGTGCQILATGTGEDFTHFVDVAQTLQGRFAELGWADDMAYVADSPTGTAFAMRMDETLALFNVSWTPAEGVECPDDQPISACEIEPAQQIYTVTIHVAEPSDQAEAAAPVEMPAQETCEAVRAALSEELGVAMNMAEVDFHDPVRARQGRACAISVTGTGQDFTSFLDVAQTMRDWLASEGWTENQAYLADGPTGTAFGYEMNDLLALGSVGWQPAEGVECPEDQPISACEVAPEQQIYTVTLELAQLGGETE